MNGTIDITGVATADQRGLDPRAAAQLLEQVGEQARHQISPRPLWLRVLVAWLVFVLYGCLYMSVRGQHPYFGPRGTWLIVMACVLLVSSGVRLAVFSNAVSGVSGTSARQLRGLAAAIIAGLACVFVLDGAIWHQHVSRAIALGVVDAAAPLIVLSAIWAAASAAVQNWRELGTAIALMAVAAGATFAGPIGVWGVIAVGGCLVLLASLAIELALAGGRLPARQRLGS